MNLAWSPGTGQVSLIILAITAGVILLAAVGIIGGTYVLQWWAGQTDYHTQAAKHAARRADNPEHAPPLIDDNWVVPYPAPPVDARPDGSVVK